jgi:hypothetical protein
MKILILCLLISAPVWIVIAGLSYWMYFYSTLFFVSIEKMPVKYGNRDYVITMRNRKKQILKFRGSGTVWCNLKTGMRAGTEREYYFSGIYQKQKWAEQNG